MDDWIINILMTRLCLWAGNYLGDQATIRDRATKRNALMLGGALIQCEVVKAKS